MFCSTAMVQYKRHSRAICQTNRDFEIILYGMHLLRGKGVSGSIQILHHCILSPIIFGPVNSIQSLKTWREKSGREFFLLSPALTPQQTISFQGAFQIVFQCFLQSFFQCFFQSSFQRACSSLRKLNSSTHNFFFANSNPQLHNMLKTNVSNKNRARSRSHFFQRNVASTV